ncbi:MAG: 3-hydroxyacyl-CoA dehydrogenase, binding domain, partial [Pseudomonadota bacterium]
MSALGTVVPDAAPNLAPDLAAAGLPPIARVAVIGAGTMGAGIAAQVANAG